jgi:hypothetical protein
MLKDLYFYLNFIQNWHCFASVRTKINSSDYFIIWICVVLSDMKFAGSRKFVPPTQGLVWRSRAAQPLALKCRSCSETTHLLAHFLTLMPQSSVKRILQLHIFHKNNNVRSFPIIGYVTASRGRQHVAKRSTQAVSLCFNVNCRTVSHKLRALTQHFYVL